MANPALRKEIDNGAFITAPGVYDLISALIADRMGFKALYVTGYGTVASSLGLPDAGLATYSEMIDRIGRIAGMTKTPVIADADTGYGGLLNVRHTVRGYEKAGVTAIQIEDQEFPKKCGHTPNRRVVPMADMVRKIEDEAAVAYDKIITRYPEMGRKDDAVAKLKAMNRPVPTPTAEAIAQNKAEQESRGDTTRFGRIMGNFHKGPDVAHAAKIGEPTMEDPKQTNATKQIRGKPQFSLAISPVQKVIFKGRRNFHHSNVE